MSHQEAILSLIHAYGSRIHFDAPSPISGKAGGTGDGWATEMKTNPWRFYERIEVTAVGDPAPVYIRGRRL